jgi:hypothetical protein
MINIRFYNLVLALLFASLSAIMACTDCSSLANNDNVPQGDGPLLFLYRGEGFQDGPVGIPEGYVSIDFAIQVSSLKCPPGYEVILYDQPENMGEYRILSGDVASLKPYDFAGRVHSLRFSRIQHPQIFERSGFEGEQQLLSFGVTILPELTFFRSLKVPAGMTVTLTTAIGPKSVRSYDFTSDTSDLQFSDPVKSVSVKTSISIEF